MTGMVPPPPAEKEIRFTARLILHAHRNGRAVLCEGCRSDKDDCDRVAWARQQLAATGG